MEMMKSQHHSHHHHDQPSVARSTVGWILIALGMTGIILPVIPGVVFFVLGVVVIGPRNPVLRRAAVLLRLALRRWCRVRNQTVARLGWWVRLRHRTVRLAVRERVGQARRGEYRRRHYLAWAALFVLSMIAYAGVAFVINLGLDRLG